MSAADTTRALKRALAERHADEGWAYFTEVPTFGQDKRGLKTVRLADALAFGLWQSRGLHLHGFEIKATRSDWLRELKDGAKAEAAARYCDFWWVVTVPGVVADGELPVLWGLMELSDKTGKLRIKVRAPQQEHVAALDRNFVATMLREGTRNMMTRDEWQLKIQDIEERARERAKRELDVSHVARGYEELQRQVHAFRDATGIDIEGNRAADKWAYGLELGEATAIVLEHGHRHVLGQLEQLEERAAYALKMIRESRRKATERVEQLELGGVA